MCRRRRLAAAFTVVLLAGRAGAGILPAGAQRIESVALAPLDGVPLVLVEEALDGSVGLEFSEDAVEVTLGADVLFAFDSAELQPDAEQNLDEARTLLARATGTVAIVGHSDDVGTDEYNNDLSQRRAESVSQALAPALAAAGVQASVTGAGETMPVVSNSNEDGSDNPEGRQRNRRVTVSIPVPSEDEGSE